MNQWPNGQSNMFSQQSAMFSNPAASFDLNGTFPQGLPNGAVATPNSAYPPQNFQTGSVVPAKRPHDGMSGSPQQLSRSQTPSYPGFSSAQSTNQHFANAPNPYQHLQQQTGSNNATPSPTMSNQPFRPPQSQSAMQNVSPSPYSQPQSVAQQPGANFGNQMTPTTPQNPNQGGMTAQQMAGWNQSMTMMGNNGNMQMSGMAGPMPTTMNSNATMNGQPMNGAQRAYQMKMLQQQQQLRASGMMGSMGLQQAGVNALGGYGGLQAQQQQQPAQTALGQPSQPMTGNMPMSNGSGPPAGAMAMNPQQQAQAKRTQFLKALAAQAAQQGRQVNLNPQIAGRSVDLYMLWTMAVQAGLSQAVERTGQWSAIATKLGFPQPQFPSAADEVKQIYTSILMNYERMWLAMRAQQKQEQARQHAHQMAGLGAPQQASPTKQMMSAGSQPGQYPVYPHGAQGQALQQMQQQPPLMHNQTQAQSTPIQASAQLPPNAVATPQQMMQHRRNSSLRRPEHMTPQSVQQPMVVPSPHPIPKPQQSPSIKHEQLEPPLKHEDPRSTNYTPIIHPIEHDGGYDITALYDIGSNIARFIPNMPVVDEMGVIDTRAITMSLASGIHSEVRYALDMLAIISHDQRISFDLEKCDDLIDVIIDCAEEQNETLDEDSSDQDLPLNLLSYEEVMRASRAEMDEFQDISQQGEPAYIKDRAVERLLALTTVLRNLSFFECNHRLLTASPVVKWLCNTIRLVGTRPLFLKTAFNTQDFYKDIITFLSNVTQSLELTSKDDALHVLHFLLAFAPQPQPRLSSENHGIRFRSFVPAIHRYLPPAVDCLAKLLARQDPNRAFYRSILGGSSGSSDSAADLLTRAFGLAISVLPDRSRGALSNNMQLRMVEARKAYLSQGMLAADILSTLIPSGDAELARSWMESEDGWAVSLLNLAALLSVDRTSASANPKARDANSDADSHKLITHRALAMIKRLAEKAARTHDSTVRSHKGVDRTDEGSTGDGETEELRRLPKWDGMPQGHAVLGALMLPNTDRVSLGLLCGLHEMAMQASP